MQRKTAVAAYCCKQLLLFVFTRNVHEVDRTDQLLSAQIIKRYEWDRTKYRKYWAGALMRRLKLPACNSVKMAGSNLTLAVKFQRKEMILPRSLVKIQYCGEPPSLRGSVLGLRQPGPEFRIWCLEGGVTSFISPSSGGGLLDSVINRQITLCKIRKATICPHLANNIPFIIFIHKNCKSKSLINSWYFWLLWYFEYEYQLKICFCVTYYKYEQHMAVC